MDKRTLLLLLPAILLTGAFASLPSCSNNPAAPAPVTVTQPVTIYSTFTNTPTGSATPTFTFTLSPTSTSTPVTILVTSTFTPTGSATSTFTSTLSPTSTWTPVTILVTSTFTPTGSATPTDTVIPTPPTVTSWSTGGSLGVAVSGSNIFVGDYSENVEVYDLTGNPVTTVGLSVFASGIVSDGSGGVYVAGSGNHVVKHIDNSFAVAGSFSTAYTSSGIASDGSGNLYITDGAGGSNRIQKYTTAGVLVTTWPVPDGNPWGIAIAGSPQTIYVASTTSHKVYTFDLNGYGEGLGWTLATDGSALGVDGLGRIFACGYSSGGAMQRFDLLGNLQVQWGSFTTEGIAFDGSNNIYIGSGPTLQVFGP